MQKILTGLRFSGPSWKAENSMKECKDDFEIKDYAASFGELDGYAIAGAEILKQIPGRRMIEIETGRGCKVGKCSFCTEPIKSAFTNRKMESVAKRSKSVL